MIKLIINQIYDFNNYSFIGLFLVFADGEALAEGEEIGAVLLHVLQHVQVVGVQYFFRLGFEQNQVEHHMVHIMLEVNVVMPAVFGPGN